MHAPFVCHLQLLSDACDVVCNVGLKGVGRSPGVERLYRGHAAAENFSYEETALVASRYIEGHALTLCIYTVTV